MKMPLSARHGIREAWRVNFLKRMIEVYSDLTDGRYVNCAKFKIGGTLVSPTVAGLSLKVDEIIG